MFSADEIIHNLPKALIGWYDFENINNCLYIGDSDDALYEELSEHVAGHRCYNLKDLVAFDTESAERYDLIVLTSVFETADNVRNIINTLLRILSPTGRLLIAMNNRFGIRYFSGDRDPYTERNFDGIEDYRRAYSRSEDIFSGRCYSRSEMLSILISGGIAEDMCKFYSVFPDLSSPTYICAEEYTPKEDLSNRIFPIYNYPASVFFEEETIYSDLVKEGLFHKMANAYLVEVSPAKVFSHVLNITSSLERGEKGALYTIINNDNTVTKAAVYDDGIKRLNQLNDNANRLAATGVLCVEGTLDGNSYTMPYIDAPTGQYFLKELIRKDVKSFISALDHINELINKSSEEATPEETEEWKNSYRLYREDRRKRLARLKGKEYKPDETRTDFFDFDLGKMLRYGFIDMIPLNSFYLDDEYIFYDQEFCMDVCPANFIMYRVIASMYSHDTGMNKYMSMDDVLKRYGLFADRLKWSELETNFLRDLRKEDELNEYHNVVKRDYLTVGSNRQRMNYSQDEYERLFVNVFEHADTRPLILFGAGAYARKFIKLYGEDYTVKAIVDNSPEKWGQFFEGIEVKSPSILTELHSGEYKLIICIKNYTSVMKQVNSMGITGYSIYDAGRSYPKSRKPIEAGRVSEDMSSEKKRYHVGYVAGVFDLYHIGHQNIFRRAKEQCDYLIVGVVSDEGVRENKKTDPFIPFNERIELVRGSRYVDEAVEIPHGFHDTIDAYKLYHFDVQFSGSDYEHDKDWLNKQKYLREHGSDLVFFPYTQSTSSTKLKEAINVRTEEYIGVQKDEVAMLDNRSDDSLIRVVSSPRGISMPERPSQGIADICEAGFRFGVLDCAMYVNEKDLEDLGRPNRKPLKYGMSDAVLEPYKLSSLMDSFLSAAKKNGLSLPIAYAPFLQRDTKHKDLNGHIEELAVETIKLAGRAGTEYVVVRQLFADIEYGDEWSVNKPYYLRLAEVAKANNVMILLENQCKDVYGHLVRGVCTDGIQAAKWVDELNNEVEEDRFGFCVDIGVCNICGVNMYDYFVDLGDRVKAIVLRECNGDKEQEILPFTQEKQTDYLAMLRGLRKIGFSGLLVLDYKDTAYSTSPILKPEIIRFAKSVGDYIKWQIDIENMLRKYPKRVLFGAGNMCRNYMKCYGEEYPPLFTCDNNKSVWGNDFCGLEIKSPEALKNLPEDCVIFICNMYYREIQAQLREMGITNPIEFFNDEYMPSFYFDRLEDKR